jgi:hypothetical protein
MNCDVSQRRLLALPEPADLPPALREHLEVCPHCQEMQRRLVQVERNAPLLPVPASTARAEFLERFRGEGTVAEKFVFHLRELKRWQVLSGAIAAGLLMFFAAWMVAPQETPSAKRQVKNSPPDKFVATLVSRTSQLSVAESARDQVTSLADLAGDLLGQSQPLVWYGNDKEGKESLKDLADWYGQVVRMNVVRAGDLKPEQRKPVLEPIIRQLAQASDDAEQLARETNAGSADHPLFTIAFAARNGKDQLGTLLKHDMAEAPKGPRRLHRPVGAVMSDEMAVRRLALSAMLTMTLSAARADDAKATISYEQAQRFVRNRKLIDALVRNCVDLARPQTPDFVQRADLCTNVADQLAEELQRAARERDLGRATQLSKLLKDILAGGVAFNLTTTGREIPIGGLSEPKMLQIGDRVQRLTGQLEEQLGKVADKDTQEQWQRVTKNVADGRAEVYKALKGRGAY